jgi:hypothetical protein
MMNSRVAPVSAVLVVLALLLGGCSGEDASSGSKADAAESPSSSRTPTPPAPLASPSVPPVGDEVAMPSTDADPADAPDAAPTPAREVVVGAREVAVQGADGSSRASAAFTAPSQVLALLTSELGAPYSTTHDTQCGYDIARWDRLFGAPLEVWAQFDPHPGGPPTIVYVNAATAAGLRIESSAGFAVGDDVAAFVASLPTDRVNISLATAIWEAGDTPSQGGLAHVGGGRVGGMVSPAALDGSLRAACWSL